MIDESNSKKAKAGAQSKRSLKKHLQEIKSKGIIEEFTSCKFGYKNKKKDQFKCDYLLTFKDKTKWVIFSATSLTTDRLKTKQWDAYNIKEIDEKIEKAYVVCPDIPKTSPINRYRKDIRNDIIKSAIDDILSLREFCVSIDDKDPSKGLNGKIAAKNGLNFERKIKGILENGDFLQQWKNDQKNSGISFQIFKKIMDKLKLDKANVVNLSATTKIPKLPDYKYKDETMKKGGKPKTDIVLSVIQKDNHLGQEFTFSCKKSSSDEVGVFEFPAKYCAEILGDKYLENLLNEYVECGGPKNMVVKNGKKAKCLEEHLKKYVDEFNRWALRGTEKNHSKQIQLADYIICYNAKKDDLTIETIDECIDRIKNGNKKGHFGTIFTWTVTKKDQKGKRKIKLKIPC